MSSRSDAETTPRSTRNASVLSPEWAAARMSSVPCRPRTPQPAADNPPEGPPRRGEKHLHGDSVLKTYPVALRGPEHEIETAGQIPPQNTDKEIR